MSGEPNVSRQVRMVKRRFRRFFDRLGPGLISGAADERQYAVIGIVAIEPFKSTPVEILLKEGRLSTIERVQVF